ncbi:MAG TPA: zinc ribbon domain-containing protein [Pyrinomonadaceae bacterium]|nr:zinc ribbon domain-containing protein [Pyrinomonadaceae bacterium]
MYCPTCGTQNSSDGDVRFCRSCGADLRAVSRAMDRSLPVRFAAALDSYFENRYQQNLRNGVLNVLAFLFLLIAGTWHLVLGWTGFGIFMLVLSVISIVTGIWDIWIYRRNLPPIANRSEIDANPATHQLNATHDAPQPPLSITEPTTKILDLTKNRTNQS